MTRGSTGTPTTTAPRLGELARWVYEATTNGGRISLLLLAPLGERRPLRLHPRVASVRSLAHEERRNWVDFPQRQPLGLPPFGDRKSTRLNSSHANISYAV